MTVVVQAAEHPMIERHADGQVGAVIGCVDTGSAVVEISVGGNPPVVDMVVQEQLPEDGEAMRDTLDNISAEQRTLAGAELDDDGAQGLIRLLTTAAAVRKQALADVVASRGNHGSGATGL